MAGSLTLAGMADGLLSGQATFGPSTVSGTEAISETLNVTLEPNVDYVVKVPSAAVQFACFFTYRGEGGPEMKLGSNLNVTSGGFPIRAEGFVSGSIASGVTELKFKAASPPPTFQLCFV